MRSSHLDGVCGTGIRFLRVRAATPRWQLVIASGAARRSVTHRGPATLAAIDPDRMVLDSPLAERAVEPEPAPVIAWIRDPAGVRVIDADAADEMTIAPALLDAFGVESDRPITFLTRAIDTLPPELREPLA